MFSRGFCGLKYMYKDAKIKNDENVLDIEAILDLIKIESLHLAKVTLS